MWKPTFTTQQEQAWWEVLLVGCINTVSSHVAKISGCDLSGIVEEVGKDCKSDVKKGDKVYGVCHCANLVRQSLQKRERIVLIITERF